MPLKVGDAVPPKVSTLESADARTGDPALGVGALFTVIVIGYALLPGLSSIVPDRWMSIQERRLDGFPLS